VPKLTPANTPRFPEFLFQFQRGDSADKLIEQVTRCPLLAHIRHGIGKTFSGAQEQSGPAELQGYEGKKVKA
jgi:hypothetical protein